MPEQITRYPNVTLKVLDGAGARCGVGAKQEILTKCPRERFCSLQSGEICVYGLDEVPNMTQVSVKQIQDLYCKTPAKGSLPAPGTGLHAALLLAVLVVGVVAGRWFRTK